MKSIVFLMVLAVSVLPFNKITSQQLLPQMPIGMRFPNDLYYQQMYDPLYRPMNRVLPVAIREVNATTTEELSTTGTSVAPGSEVKSSTEGEAVTNATTSAATVKSTLSSTVASKHVEPINDTKMIVPVEAQKIEENKQAALHTLVQQLYQAEAQVQLEAQQIQRAQEVASAAQQTLEEATNNVRIISGALQNAQEAVAAAAMRAHTAQLQLAAHDQLLFTARQNVDSLSAQMVGVQAEVGIQHQEASVDLPDLLGRLRQPLPSEQIPSAIPPLVPFGSDIQKSLMKQILEESQNGNYLHNHIGMPMQNMDSQHSFANNQQLRNSFFSNGVGPLLSRNRRDGIQESEPLFKRVPFEPYTKMSLNGKQLLRKRRNDHQKQKRNEGNDPLKVPTSVESYTNTNRNIPVNRHQLHKRSKDENNNLLKVLEEQQEPQLRNTPQKKRSLLQPVDTSNKNMNSLTVANTYKESQNLADINVPYVVNNIHQKQRNQRSQINDNPARSKPLELTSSNKLNNYRLENDGKKIQNNTSYQNDQNSNIYDVYHGNNWIGKMNTNFEYVEAPYSQQIKQLNKRKYIASNLQNEISPPYYGINNELLLNQRKKRRTQNEVNKLAAENLKYSFNYKP